MTSEPAWSMACPSSYKTRICTPSFEMTDRYHGAARFRERTEAMTTAYTTDVHSAEWHCGFTHGGNNACSALDYRLLPLLRGDHNECATEAHKPPPCPRTQVWMRKCSCILSAASQKFSRVCFCGTQCSRLSRSSRLKRGCADVINTDVAS